jgi:hypothetical protein
VGRGAPRDVARAAMLSTLARRAARSTSAARRGFAADASGGAPAGAGSTAAGALRPVVAVGIAGATALVVEDALNDLALWRICKNHAVPVIETHPRLLRSLGAPFRSEAWWNSSVTSKARGNLASCVFLVDGSRASCDVQVVMMRDPAASRGAFAWAPNLLRNLAAPTSWRVARMEAILPHEREAGLPGRVNLLQEPEPKGAVLEKQSKSKARGWRGWFGRGKGKRAEDTTKNRAKNEADAPRGK